MYTFLLFVDLIIVEYLMLIMTALSLAVLFVYRPKKFKALPWIVLVIMELTFLVRGFWSFSALLWCWCSGEPEFVTFKDFTRPIFKHFGYVGLPGETVIIVSAIPILALWGMLIVGAVQKKKKASEENDISNN